MSKGKGKPSEAWLLDFAAWEAANPQAAKGEGKRQVGKVSNSSSSGKNGGIVSGSAAAAAAAAAAVQRELDSSSSDSESSTAAWRRPRLSDAALDKIAVRKLSFSPT